MSISVTVSGQESTSVVSVQPLSNTISVSGISKEISVTRSSENSATVTVSTGDPITVTSNFSNFITGTVVRPNQISSFITNSDLSDLNTATGNLNTRVNALESFPQVDQNVNTTGVPTFGGLFVSGNILPTNDLAYDIGSSGQRFRDLYLSGDSIYLGD